MDFSCPDGATPIDADEATGLIPNHISTQRELNEWESQNIQYAHSWGFSRNRSELLTVEFIKDIHKRMFNETWTWAGHFRLSDKNFGVPWDQIAVETHKSLDDVKCWLNESVFGIQESAIRLHYRLVVIHPFVNGNGRHARLLCDILLFNYDLPRIEWGTGSLDSGGAERERYISALIAADRGDFKPLLSYIPE